MASAVQRVAAAFHQLLPSVLQQWPLPSPNSVRDPSLASAQGKDVGAATIPDFTVVRRALEERIVDFATKHEEVVKNESAAKEALGLSLRQFLSGVIMDAFVSNSRPSPVEATFACCDIALLCFRAGLMDIQFAFSLIEETADMLSIADCSSLWTYAEVRKALLTEGLTSGRGTALSVLRTSNELLRRITKSDIADASFGGRVLGFVSEVFPLDEKAGRNLLGTYNTANVTKLEPKQKRSRQLADDGDATARDDVADGDKSEATGDEPDDESNDGLFPPNFYEDFWALQRFFANPRSLADPYTASEEDKAEPASNGAASETSKATKEPNSLKYFFKVDKTVLDVFAKIQEKERERSSVSRNGAQSKDADVKMNDGLHASTSLSHQATTPPYPFLHPISSASGPLKRKREELDGVDVKRNRTRGPTSDDGDDQAEGDALFFPKFLTGRRLLKYELQDPSFRLHVLLQHFVMFQYVLSWYGGDDRWSADKVKVAALQRPFALSDEDNTKFRRSFWPQVSSLVRGLKAHMSTVHSGATFVTSNSLRSGTVPTLFALESKSRQAERGPDYLGTANQIIRREQHWVLWKNQGCEPPIERSWSGQAGGGTTNEAEERKALNEARSKLSGVLNRAPGPPGQWEHSLGTAALSRLWERGFPPPVEGTRLQENDEGIEELCKTDGLEALEGFLRDMPTLDELGQQVRSAEDRVVERTAELKKERAERRATALAEKQAEGKDEGEEKTDVKEEVETEESLAQALQADEDYRYLDETRLHASWKYLRLARASTVPHWKELGPSSVAQVLARVKRAEAAVTNGTSEAAPKAIEIRAPVATDTDMSEAPAPAQEESVDASDAKTSAPVTDTVADEPGATVSEAPSSAQADLAEEGEAKEEPQVDTDHVMADVDTPQPEAEGAPKEVEEKGQVEDAAVRTGLHRLPM